MLTVGESRWEEYIHYTVLLTFLHIQILFKINKLECKSFELPLKMSPEFVCQ